ncbi:MAG TPA: hypothetical protein VF584_24740 [Longimicrobium sp.]|jgi:hypothetical protein
MKVLTLIALTGALFLGESTARVSRGEAQAAPTASCPPADRSGASIVRKLLASPPRTALRWAAESARLRYVPARPLSGSADQELCSRLNRFVTPSVVEDASVSRSYYALDAYYIVVLRRERGSRVQKSEFSPVIILNRDLQPVEVLGM